MDLRTTLGPAADGEAVIVVEGSIDLESRHELVRRTDEVFTDTVTRRVLDLGGVTFIDSTGIGALVTLAGDADDAGAEFVIRNPSRSVSRILEVIGMPDRWIERTTQPTE